MTDEENMATFNEILGHLLRFFKDDFDKASLWFRLPNPSLGGLIPNDLIRMGRIGKLAEFVRNAMAENEAAEAARGRA
jgi:hypothetical protein